MGIEYNIYDIDVLRQGINDFRKFNITTHKKIEHTAKVFELQKLMNSVCEKTHAINLDPEYHSNFRQYYNAITLEFRKTKKEWLDTRIKFIIEDCIKELNSCISVEHQTFNGRLIPDPKYFGSWIEPDQLQKRIDYEATR